MIALPYDYFLIAWFVLAAGSTAYVAFDQFNGNPEPTVMKWGFILVTLYMGPFGLLLYVLADKEPRPGEHEHFTSPLWKQGVGSTIHCVAGDATGIILAATVTALLGLPMWIDLIVEYIAGFSFGLFIFQSLFMKKMMGGTYWENVRKSFMPEFISMNAMMAGMAPTMSLLMMGRDMRAMDPLEFVFWGVMSLGVMVGFTTAYPFNVWMVKKKIKHGLMTERPEPPGQQRDMSGMKSETGQMSDDQMSHMEGHGGQQKAKKSGEREVSHGGGHQMGGDATTPQLAALACVTSFLLISGMVIPGFSVNLGLSARDVDGSIMPPGMINTFDLPGEAMKDMAAVKPRQVAYVAAPDARGDKVLAPRIENGVKVFDIKAEIIRWNILPDVAVEAYAYNHEFDVGQSGTYFYHSHDHPDRQQALGLYGALLIAPKDPSAEVKADLDYTIQLQEWLKREWLTYPAMLMEGALPNYFTINGKAYPSTDTVAMKVGQTIKLRFIGTNNNFVHPMHVHGGPFEVVAVDGVNLKESARYQADTVNVGPGQRYDVVWTARKPGKWLVHCHIPHHTANNNVEQHGGGGLMLVLNVQ